MRLGNLLLTPNSFAFVMDNEGTLVAVSSNKVASLVGDQVDFEASTVGGISLLGLENEELRETLRLMQAGESGTDRIELGSTSLILAYAPLKELGWSFAIVEPVADIAASAHPLRMRSPNQ